MNDMSIEVNSEEILEVFNLLDELNDFFHNPLNHQSIEQVDAFSNRVYPDIKKAYYKTVWNWLPKEVQDELS
jgi:hypothetical protein